MPMKLILVHSYGDICLINWVMLSLLVNYIVDRKFQNPGFLPHGYSEVYSEFGRRCVGPGDTPPACCRFWDDYVILTAYWQIRFARDYPRHFTTLLIIGSLLKVTGSLVYLNSKYLLDKLPDYMLISANVASLSSVYCWDDYVYNVSIEFHQVESTKRRRATECPLGESEKCSLRPLLSLTDQDFHMV